MFKLRIISLSLIFWLSAVFPCWALTSYEAQIIAAVKRAKSSVVNITTYSSSGSEGTGSGVIIRKDGYILTNAHVIRGAKIIRVRLADGSKYRALVWKASPDKDLALIKIEAGGLRVPDFGDSDQLQLGQTVIAIGNPMRFSWTVTTGVISALNREITARGVNYADLIQTDAAVNLGSSGGALINSDGEVIGINTLVYTGTAFYPHAQGLSFAIPINDALKIAGSLLENKRTGVPKPWIGITGKTVTFQMAEMYDLAVKSGVYVDSVMPASPASKANLVHGDIITGANGRLVKTKEDLASILRNSRPGDILNLTVWRGASKKMIKMKVEALSQ
jgi:serine protease Do